MNPTLQLDRLFPKLPTRYEHTQNCGIHGNFEETLVARQQSINKE